MKMFQATLVPNGIAYAIDTRVASVMLLRRDITVEDWEDVKTWQIRCPSNNTLWPRHPAFQSYCKNDKHQDNHHLNMIVNDLPFSPFLGIKIRGLSCMSKVIRKIREVLSYAPVSGVAKPNGRVFFDTSCIPLVDVMKLYDRDPTCKSSVDLLAASTVGMGFYTTVDEKYDKAKEAKAVVDRFCEDINLTAC